MKHVLTLDEAKRYRDEYLAGTRALPTDKKAVAARWQRVIDTMEADDARAELLEKRIAELDTGCELCGRLPHIAGCRWAKPDEMQRDLDHMAEQLAGAEQQLTEGRRLVERVIAERERLGEQAAKPVPMRLPCPGCGALHLDEGEFATKPHHTHSCQTCGMTWRPAVVATVGVQFLPGFKNEESQASGLIVPPEIAAELVGFLAGQRQCERCGASPADVICRSGAVCVTCYDILGTRGHV